MGRPWFLISGGVCVILFSRFYLLAMIGLTALVEAPVLIIAGLGVWLLVVAGLKSMEPTPGEMEALITAGWGALLLAIGATGDLSARGFPIGFLLVILAIVLGFLMIFAAIRIWPKKTSQVLPTFR